MIWIYKGIFLRTSQFLLLLLLPLIVLSCSYSFTGANTGGLKNIYIPVFDNQTSEPGIRERLTNDLTNAIIEDNNFKISNRTSADALLSGKITRLEDVPFTFEGSGQNFATNDYKITVTATIKFESLVEKKTLWEETIVGTGRYALQGTKRRSDGLDEALKMIAQNILNKVVSNW